MNLLIYRTATGYLLLDDCMMAPQLLEPAELVLSVSTSRVPPAVTAMLGHALQENGPLELKESWADYFFGDCSGWQSHKQCLAGQLAG